MVEALSTGADRVNVSIGTVTLNLRVNRLDVVRMSFASIISLASRYLNNNGAAHEVDIFATNKPIGISNTRYENTLCANRIG